MAIYANQSSLFWPFAESSKKHSEVGAIEQINESELRFHERHVRSDFRECKSKGLEELVRSRKHKYFDLMSAGGTNLIAPTCAEEWNQLFDGLSIIPVCEKFFGKKLRWSRKRFSTSRRCALSANGCCCEPERRSTVVDRFEAQILRAKHISPAAKCNTSSCYRLRQ